jgi:hypothetical protein
MVRTVARCFLVSDLDRSLAQIFDTFGWEADAVERGPRGARALLRFRLAQSAHVELLAPAAGSEEATFLESWSPGVWAVRIGVADLDAKAADLGARGTSYQVIETGFADPPRVLRVDMAATPGCLYEFSQLA